MKKRKSVSSSKGKGVSLVKSILIGSGIGIVLWVVLLIAVSAFLAGTPEPEKYVTVCAFALIAAAAFVSGFASVKLSGHRGVLPGLSSGVLLLALVWLLSLALSSFSGHEALHLKLILAFNFLFFSFIGGIFGRPSAVKKRKSGR